MLPGQTCWFEMDELLRSKGFFVFELADFHSDSTAFKTYGTGRLRILYIRPSSVRIPEIMTMEKTAPNYCGSRSSRISNTASGGGEEGVALRKRIQVLERELDDIKSMKNELLDTTAPKSILSIPILLLGMMLGFTLARYSAGIHLVVSAMGERSQTFYLPREKISSICQKLEGTVGQKLKGSPKRELPKLTKKKRGRC
jgi:hypothetical protein